MAYSAQDLRDEKPWVSFIIMATDPNNSVVYYQDVGDSWSSAQFQAWSGKRDEAIYLLKYLPKKYPNYSNIVAIRA